MAEIETQRWVQGTLPTSTQHGFSFTDCEAILAERDQRLMTMIDNQGKDIALDFTELDKKVQQMEQLLIECSQALVRMGNPQTTEETTTTPVVITSQTTFTQPRLSTFSHQESIEKTVQALRLELDTKVDFKTLEILKKSLAQDIKVLERRFSGKSAIEHVSSPLRDNALLEKGLKDLEQKLTVKMTKAM